MRRLLATALLLAPLPSTSLAKEGWSDTYLSLSQEAAAQLQKINDERWELALEQARIELSHGMIAPNRLISRAREIWSEQWGEEAMERQREDAMGEDERALRDAALSAVRAGPKRPASDGVDPSDAGWRMYRSVVEGRLTDTSPRGLVLHASDLAGGDEARRDSILKSYYQWTLGEKQDREREMREERLRRVEAGVPTESKGDISGIRPEDASF